MLLFPLSEDQRSIQDAARAFLRVEASAERLRGALAGPDGWDRRLWTSMAALGWPGLGVPVAFGGSGLGPAETALLIEETGRVLAAAPLFESGVLAVQAVLQAGAAAQQAAILPSLASGERIATLAWTGEDGAPAPDGISVELTEDDDGVRLTGGASFVPFGHAADLIVVAARAPGSGGEAGVSLVVVPAGAPGLQIERLVTLDVTRPYSRLRLDVRLPRDAVLGPSGEAGPALRATMIHAAAALAAEQTGGAAQCLDSTVDYAKQRVQFGRVIGSFQAVKHRLADMMVLVEASRSAAYGAASAVAEGAADVEEIVSGVRAYCCDAYFHCAADAIQLHGGIGFTWEHPAHLYFKRARASATLLGDAAWHRERVAALMGLGPLERAA